MFHFPFAIRITRVGNGHAMLQSRGRSMTREQFQALIERERQVKHSFILELFGRYYELAILR
jgi:hypothetical protein